MAQNKPLQLHFNDIFFNKQFNFMNYQHFKKAIYATAVAMVTTSLLQAQEIPAEAPFSLNPDGSLSVIEDISVRAGDTLTINVPMSENFMFVEPKKKGGLGKLTKIGNIGGNIGSAVGSLGALGGSVGTLKTGMDIIHAGNVVYSTGSAAEEIADLNLSKKAKKLVGKKLVVVSIENPQDAAMGMGSAVAKEADGKKVYDVSLLQAFYTGEILLDGKHISSLYTKKEN